MCLLAAIFILLLVYLLVAPISLEVSSLRGIAVIRFHRLAGARLYVHDGSLWIEVKVTWWKKQIDLLSSRKEITRQNHEKRKKKKRKTFSFRKIKAVFRSFHVKKFMLTLDTGHMQTNGILYPVFAGIRRVTGREVFINFQGINEVEFLAVNNILRMLHAIV